MSILLTEHYTDSPKARVIPGAVFSKDEGGWVLSDPTPRAAAVALRMFPGLATEYPELVEQRASLAQEIRPFDRASEYNREIQAPRVREILAGEGHEFYRYQATDLGYLAAVIRQHGAAYNGWSRGLGKTLGTCALIDDLMSNFVLIVCPNTAKRSVWEPELKRFCPWLEVVTLRNAKPQREKDIGWIKQLRGAGQPHALIVHYEALHVLCNEWPKLGEWDFVVADEVHRIANPKTFMARELKKIKARYKLGLSGSIIQNHPEELFSPLQWLFPKHYRSRWRDWNDRYLDYVENGYSKVCVGVKIEQLEAMRNELGVFMVVRTKEDELDLPERITQDLYVELSPSQRKAYDELKAQCFTELDNGETIKATDGLVLLTRLRQVATGLDLFGESLTDSTKIDLAVDLIEDAPDEAFVVFSWYKAAARALVERLTQRGIGTFLVTGDTKQEHRAEYIRQFQDGDGSVFVGTLSTLGESVTLHRATNALFLDQAWNPSLNDQAADRIYRIGQQNAVTITRLIAKDTVDELKVMPVIADKLALRKLILGVN